MSARPTPELQTIIGEAAMVRLAEAFGGTRLYVPSTIYADHEIAQAIGMEAAQRLSQRIAPDVVRVPLARDLRARHYRAEGQTNAQIARALGMTESSVNKLLKRVGVGPSPRTTPDNTDQLDLFGQ